MVCEGSLSVVLDRTLVRGIDPDRYIECPVCLKQYGLPSGGQWDAPTIPEHSPQTMGDAIATAFDASVELT